MIYSVEGFGPDVDRPYSRPARMTSKTLQCAVVTHGYGAMRDGDLTVAATKKTLERSWQAAFVEVPETKNAAGYTRQYITVVDVTDEEIIRSVYTVGERVTVIFEPPVDNIVPDGWVAEIKPSLPMVEAPGNLILQMTRRRGDETHIDVQPFVHKLMELNQQIWIFPRTSDKATRRLVECIKKVRHHPSEDIKRYVLGRELYDGTNHGLLSRGLTDPIITAIMAAWNDSQMAIFKHIETTLAPVVFIHGPPGTGKTRFLRDIAYIFSLLKHTTLVSAPSNAAVDHFASTFEHDFPEAGIIRYHAWQSEQKQTRGRNPNTVDEETKTEDNAKMTLGDHEASEDINIDAVKWQKLMDT